MFSAGFSPHVNLLMVSVVLSSDTEIICFTSVSSQNNIISHKVTLKKTAGKVCVVVAFL